MGITSIHIFPHMIGLGTFHQISQNTNHFILRHLEKLEDSMWLTDLTYQLHTWIHGIMETVVSEKKIFGLLINTTFCPFFINWFTKYQGYIQEISESVKTLRI